MSTVAADGRPIRPGDVLRNVEDGDRGVVIRIIKAGSGIMALLPEDTVCWEVGPWPDSVVQAIKFLVDHLHATRDCVA